jgi:hypothetical protein
MGENRRGEEKKRRIFFSYDGQNFKYFLDILCSRDLDGIFGLNRIYLTLLNSASDLIIFDYFLII